ncbi:MAG: hypothetical protein R2854_05055 [Caldilineaceae bacterium]
MAKPITLPACSTRSPSRALAAYEVANLYGYGRTDWLPASLSGNTWSYAIPGGDDGIEGLYQINVRSVDALRQHHAKAVNV